MDLIHIKENLYELNSVPYDVVSSFIDKLIEIQKNPQLIKELEKRDDQGYWDRFFEKQELFNLALKINTLKVSK